MHNPLSHLVHFNIISSPSLSASVSFCSTQLFPPLDPAHTVALHSAAPPTPARDQDRGQGQDPDPGLTPFPPADPARAHAPMAAPTHAPRTPDATDAAMDVHVRGPARARGHMGTVAPARLGLRPPIGAEAGREPKEQYPTGRGHGPAHPAATGAAALARGSHLRGSSRRTR